MTNSCFGKNRALQIERDKAHARMAPAGDPALSHPDLQARSLLTVGPGITPGLLTLP